MARWVKYSLILLVLAQSCVFIRMDDSIDLGNNYRMIQDYPRTLLHHKTEDYEGIGISVVSNIVDYEFNNRFIIIKSQEIELLRASKKGTKSPMEYWIIEKDSGIEKSEPIDSIIFFQRLKELDIDLEFDGSFYIKQ